MQPFGILSRYAAAVKISIHMIFSCYGSFLNEHVWQDSEGIGFLGLVDFGRSWCSENHL